MRSSSARACRSTCRSSPRRSPTSRWCRSCRTRAASRVVLKKWLRKQRLPDAIVIEHPRYAGGHLGAAKIEDLDDPRFDFARVLEETFELFARLGHRARAHPAHRRRRHRHRREACAQLLALGAAAVQLGTPFAVTEEGDAHPNVQARAGRSAARGHRRVHERRGTARARGAHAVARRATSRSCRRCRGSAHKRRDAACSPSTAWPSAGCATGSPSRASSASTTSSAPRCTATSSTDCSSAAAARCRSAREIRPVRELIALPAQPAGGSRGVSRGTLSLPAKPPRLPRDG